MRLKSLLAASALALSSLSLASCQSTQIGELAKHLNERNCQTKGSVTGSAGVMPSLSGHMEWDCGQDRLAPIAAP